MSLRYLLAVCWSVFIVGGTPASAEVLRYTDSSGKTVYVTSPEAVPPRYRAQLDGAKPLPPISRAEFPLLAAPPPQSKAIEIYVAEWCPYCRRLESYLSSKKVRFIRYDIEESSVGAARYRALGGGGIPIIKIGDRVIRGFNEEAIQDALQN